MRGRVSNQRARLTRLEPTMQHFRALIFDCDGVLVNSEEIVQDIELALLAEHGLEYDRDDFSRRFLGTSNEHFYAGLNADSMERLGHPLADTFGDELKARAREKFNANLRAFDGVHEVADAWWGKRAVASSSSVEGLEYKLKLTGLDALFYPHVYSAEHVGKSKPHPDIYLHAASGVATHPELCIAVEDSINGVVSAKAAGMYTVGFTGGAHCRDGHDDSLSEAGADLVVESLLDLACFLGDA